MGGDRGDKRAKGEKSPRSEPNLELPSFRLGRARRGRAKASAESPEDLLKRERSVLPAERSVLPAEPSVPTREPSVPTREPSVLPAEPSVPTREPSIELRKAPPPPPLKTPPPPPTEARRPAPPPPRPSLQPTAPVPTPAVDDDWSIADLEPVELPSPIPTAEPRTRKERTRTPKPAKPPKPAKAPRPPKERQRKNKGERQVAPLRWLPGYIAAIITGGLIGGLTVVLAWATAQGCAAVRGVGTCGGYGVFALVAILGIDVVIATGILRLCRVIDPATTAMLGVGLVALLAMTFFLGETQSFVMVYVIPSLMAVTFGVAWWVTSAIARRTDEIAN